jgi:hypothetical protein
LTDCYPVCINQADDTEKSLQVLSMGRIYAIASNVVVWLGPVVDQDRMYDLLSIFDVLDEFRLHGVPDPPIDSVSFAFPSLDALFSRKWFTRRWVLQEVFLSRAMIVQCGPHKFSWQSLRHSADLRLEHENNYHWGTGTGQAAYHVTRLDFERNFREFDLRHGKLFNDTSGKVYPRLLHLLTVFRTTQCADARDRLYSLYGMSPNLYDLCPVDYEVHFSRTYTDFAHATITTGRGHEVLHHAISFGNLSQQDESWPSWVPSWNIMDKMPHLRQFIYLAVKDQENSLTWGCFADTAHCRYSDQFTKANIGEMRGLCLSGKVHPIGDTQTSRGCSTAMQFFMDRLSRWPVAGPSHDSLTSSTSVLSVAIYSAKFSCVKSEGGVNRLPTTLLPSREEETWTVSLDRQTDLIHRIIDTEMRKQLPNAMIAPADFDSAHLLQEANQLLDGQYAFLLDTSDELIFGLAFVRVEPGDLVFRRKTTLAPGLVVEPVCALVIRPYRSPSSPRRDLFRLVGACVDSYALMHGSGPKYEERDIVLV